MVSESSDGGCNQQKFNLIYFVFPNTGTDYEAALDSLLEQVETETCDAFDDDGDFQIAEIFLE